MTLLEQIEAGQVSHPLAGVVPELAVEGHPVWAEIAPEITPGEFNYPHLMDVHFLRLLSKIRRWSGVPFRFRSDHRPPARNAAAGGATASTHMEIPCRAVDLWLLSTRERYALTRTCIVSGLTRVGIAKYAVDPATGGGTFHIDGSTEAPQFVAW